MTLLPRIGLLRRKFEAWRVRRAAAILMGRNVERAGVTSRRDNNDMWYAAEKLESIARRISSNYTKGSQ